MFSTIVRRASQPKFQYDIYNLPYKAQRLWPPDFSKIPQKHQFRLERKYKRRAKLKWARPRWTKAVKIVQLGSILFIAVYGVLFLDWNTTMQEGSEHKPFNTIRSWFWSLTGPIWSKDQVRRKDSPEDASPVANPSS